MRLELVTMIDERGEAIWFVDRRTVLGSLVASEWFPTERAAREFLAMGVD
jgi:hypothetical protein